METYKKPFLSVNLNAVAYLRNRRSVPWPNLIEIAEMILLSGAKGITVHPRPDERHITRRDVNSLKDLMGKAEFKGKEFNIEGYPSEEFLGLVNEICPDQITLVPDTPEQSTSDDGWDMAADKNFLFDVKEKLIKSSRTAVFVEPCKNSILATAEIGFDRVEIYTGVYGSSESNAESIKLADELVNVISEAKNNELEVNLGHDLNLSNLGLLIDLCRDRQVMFDEVSIGHSFWAESLKFGLVQTVKKFDSLLKFEI